MLRKVPNSVGQLSTDQSPKADGLTNSRPRPSQVGDTVTTRPRPTLGGSHNHDSLEANLGREIQSRLARGQPWVGDAVTARSRPTSDKQHISDLPKATPERETQS
jgi:hypothetical protein